MEILKLIFMSAIVGELLAQGSGDLVKLKLSAPVLEVVLGQPLLATLEVTNNSSRPILVPTDRHLLRVGITGPRQEVFASTQDVYSNPNTTIFWNEVKAGATNLLDISVNELAQVPRPGEYTVSVTIPDVGKSSSIHVLVRPYDRKVLDEWAKQTTDEIISGTSSRGLELTKALASVHGDISEPYLCRLLLAQSPFSIPAVVDKLKETGTIQAAQCMISALSLYSQIHKDYIESALSVVRGSTSNPEVRKEINEAIGSPK